MSTLKEVAARCGLDISTVSRALRGDERVKGETAVRVRRAAEELHYTPNLAARNLVKGKSRTFCLITPGLSNPVDRLPAQYACAWMQERDYDLMISLTGREGKIFERQIARLEQNLFDGAVIIPGHGITEKAENILARLQGKGFPLVFLDRWDSRQIFPVVTTDNEAAGAGLAERLIARGCGSLIILSDRQNGVEKARVKGEIAGSRRGGVEPVVLGLEDESAPSPSPGGPVGIISTSYVNLMDFVRRHEKILALSELFYAVFDEWPGAVYPAQDIILCEQDFEGMAHRACELLVNRGDEKSGGKKITLSAKAFRSLKEEERYDL